MVVVNCVDLGDPPFIDGIPPPVRFVGAGIGNDGNIAAVIIKNYPETGYREVAMCLITPYETFSFTSPFGFTALTSPSEALFGNDKVVFCAESPRTPVALLGDSNTRTVTQLPRLGDHGMYVSHVCGESIYGTLAIVDLEHQGGAFRIRGDKIQRIKIDGYSHVDLDTISPNEKFQHYWAVPTGKPLSQGQHILVSGETVWPVDPEFAIHNVNDSGVAVALSHRDPYVVVLLAGKNETRIPLSKISGAKACAPRWEINAAGLVAGTYQVDKNIGACLIYKEAVIDLMTHPSIAQYNFSKLCVEGINDANQILLEGEIADQPGSRLYRCDVDLSGGPSALRRRFSRDRFIRGTDSG